MLIRVLEDLHSQAVWPCVYNNERSHPFLSQHLEIGCSVLKHPNSKRRRVGWAGEGWMDGGSEMQLNVHTRL